MYALAPFPLPGLAELREQYTYNINPFSDASGDRSPRSALGRGSSDEEEDVDDLEGVGCLGALLPFSEFAPGNGIKALGPGDADVNDIAAASPGVFATDGYSPLPYTTKQFGSRGSRVHEEMSYLQKQYARMRQMQQNAVVVFSEATVQNIQESEKRKSIPAAINHLLVSATKKKIKTARSHFGVKKGNEAKTSERLRVDDATISHKGEAKPEVKPNAYEKESMQHLNELFKGDQKERKEARQTTEEEQATKTAGKEVDTASKEVETACKEVETKRTMDNFSKEKQSEEKKDRSVDEKPAKKDKKVTPSSTRKIQHVGLNGEVSSLETGKSKKNPSEVFGFNSGRKPPKVTVVESSSLKVTAANNETPPRPVKVVDRRSPSVLDTSAGTFTGTGRVFTRSNHGSSNSSNSSWLLEEDKRCKYPDNFRPFPQRNKQPSRSRILYGNLSDKGAKRMDAFHGRKETRQGFNGVAVNGTTDSKRS